MTKYKNSPGRRKAFGQHFLKDRALAQRIAQETLQRAVASQSTRILEIGHIKYIKNPTAAFFFMGHIFA